MLAWPASLNPSVAVAMATAAQRGSTQENSRMTSRWKLAAWAAGAIVTVDAKVPVTGFIARFTIREC